MKYRIFAAVVTAALLINTLFWQGAVAQAPEELSTAGRKIIVFAPGMSDAERDAVLGETKVKRAKRLHRALEADVLTSVQPHELARLLANPKVKRVDDDVVVYALARAPKGGVSTQAQTLPWGIDRVDAELVWPTGNTANPIKVGIIDTGISLAHPDLSANIKGGYNAIRPWKNADDDNGHGSHVAGIVAAVNDSTGVVGAAHQADLYAIKVLNASGSGYLSDVIEGIDWAILQKLQVINMSLGTSSNVASLHEAVVRARQAGLVEVAAAGNNGGAVIYPAAYPEVIAVGATDQQNAVASWSSRGPELDLAAPGVNIYSTYKGKSYTTLSGTSMASPHVAGAAALLLNTPIDTKSDGNGNGQWDPDEIQTKLQQTATDLGAAGNDTVSGWGLANAFQATQ
ncbi:S8 family peptidase [Candidatus Parcubacteria bacterium]|nr:S8 family peptidase [Candidatus Parcubacteria bacterium]